MSRVVEQLAELTGFRDRDLLDVSLVGALRDLLRPDSVAIYRCVGEAGRQRWLTRARIERNGITPEADPLWAELDTLPALASHPDRHACLLQRQTASVAPDPSGPATTYFALTADNDEGVGVLEVSTPRVLGSEDLRLVGSILRIYRNFQGLLDYSERDTLTGLLNRKTFDESFLRVSAQVLAADTAGVNGSGSNTAGQEPRRAPTTSSFWLGLIDIDHFKRVNDNYGHLIGDEVLLLLSRLMRSSFRFHDHLYRFGGEEFVVLMRCGDAAAAAVAMERLRVNVESYAFPQVGRITVSIGFTALRAGDTPSAAFDRADKAVYYAKQNGRNQVGHHADLVASGKLADESRSSDVELF